MSSLLRRLDADRLAGAFAFRPDLLHPRPPADLGELAGRVTRRDSVRLALRDSDRWSMQVAEVAVVLGGPTSAEEIASIIHTTDGGPPTETQVVSAIDRLCGRLLLFTDEAGGVWLNPGLLEAMPRPCALGLPAADLLKGQPAAVLRGIVDAAGIRPASRSNAGLVAAIVAAFGDPDVIGPLVASAPPDSLAVLERAWNGYVDLPYMGWGRHSPQQRGRPFAWILERGLVVDPQQAYGYGRAEVPREVGIAVRGGVAIRDGMPDMPPLTAVRAGDVDDLDRRGAGRAGATVRSVTQLINVLGDAPLMPLRDGGIGTKEGRRVAKLLDTSPNEVLMFAELAAGAGRVTASPYEPVVPTAGVDAWLSTPASDRWIDLADAWFSHPSIPSAAGRKDPRGKLVPAFSRLAGVDAFGIRRTVLELLSRLAPGHRLFGHVVGPAAWILPAAIDPIGDPAVDLIDWTLDEAQALGVVADGALTTVGRLVFAGDLDAARLTAAKLLVEAPAELILQADLTAVVDAAAPQDVLDELRLLADAESKGSAVVFRFSPASVRRAFDAGRDAEQILSFLNGHATRGLPQPLEYLVSDVARRWGSLRAGAVQSYLRADDPALLEEAVRHKRLAKLGLRLVAPTVAVAPCEAEVLLAALRDAGFLPVEEDEAGVTRLRSQARLRSADRRVIRAPTLPPRSADELRRIAEAVLAAKERVAPPLPSPRPALVQRYDEYEDFGNEFERDLQAGLEGAFEGELDEGVDAFIAVAVLAGTGAIVELRWYEHGLPTAVTGEVLDVDAPTGIAHVRREPDGTVVTVQADAVMDIRLLRSGPS